LDDGLIYSSLNAAQIELKRHLTELKMNIAKNMETIFLSAVAVIALTGFATAAVPAKHAAPAAVVAKADANMPVVVVSAKRLTAAEKAAL
jgi:hypothetical protein